MTWIPHPRRPVPVLVSPCPTSRPVPRLSLPHVPSCPTSRPAPRPSRPHVPPYPTSRPAPRPTRPHVPPRPTSRPTPRPSLPHVPPGPTSRPVPPHVPPYPVLLHTPSCPTTRPNPGRSPTPVTSDSRGVRYVLLVRWEKPLKSSLSGGSQLSPDGNRSLSTSLWGRWAEVARGVPYLTSLTSADFRWAIVAVEARFVQTVWVSLGKTKTTSLPPTGHTNHTSPTITPDSVGPSQTWVSSRGRVHQ